MALLILDNNNQELRYYFGSGDEGKALTCFKYLAKILVERHTNIPFYKKDDLLKLSSEDIDLNEDFNKYFFSGENLGLHINVFSRKLSQNDDVYHVKLTLLTRNDIDEKELFAVN